MDGAKAIFWCLCFMTVFKSFVRSEQNFKGFNETLQLDISRGIRLQIENGETRIDLKMSALVNGNEVEGKSTGRLKFKSTLKKIGMAMMMAPLMIQLLSLPSAIGSIKLNLLKSIFVGKIALLMMIYSLIKNSQRSEVVVVHKPEYHEHFYHDFHQPEDMDDWGRR
ncbi:uncharacterized protein LOC143183282 [Calliopsis andreniformis]|uniref:uncharacterized protein LOC143183282 n=1 Tax=Calliopsis andreniformis TaxID=337506 RepID=UPI003FCC3E03